MKMIVGLGNPGPKYALTRHNVGFLLVDALAEQTSSNPFKTELKALVAKTKIDGEAALLVKPQTFMNLSGESVRPLMDYYKIEMKDLLVAHDEIDIAFAQLRFHIRRGPGGHNGIKSLIQHFGGNDFARLKLGVGRPSHPSQEVSDYVLENFSKDEMKQLPDYIGEACSAVEYFVGHGIERSANQYNGAK